MAPTYPKTKSKKFAEREGALNKAVNPTMGIKKKRKWVHEHKLFEGSVKEGEFLDFYLQRSHQITIKVSFKSVRLGY